MNESYHIHLRCKECDLMDIVHINNASSWKCPICKKNKSKGEGMKEWIGLRNRWPVVPGTYRVKDCRQTDFNCEGESYYDGWDFNHWKPKDEPLKGSLLLRTYTVTHWMPSIKGNL